MDYKEETRKSYDKFPKDFENKFRNYIEDYLVEEIKEFLKRLPPKAKILDIGCAAGDKALYLKKLGYELTCIDISEEMVKICKENGLNARVMDCEDMEFAENSFDGVLAYTSLLHVPKNKLLKIIERISEIMKSGGWFFLGMKEGDGEGFRGQEKYPGTKRWFSLYRDNELREYLLKYFNVDFYSETKRDESHMFLNYILKKK